MQFSESWLRTLVNPSQSSEELSHLLTMAGLEVEDRTPVAPVFDKVVVAQVLTKDKHPDADRLNILTVNVGQAEALTIVCGAQNVSVGMKAPCALIGAKLPGIEIKQAKVRGTASFGMMCSQTELGLAKESSGLMELSPEAVVGKSIREHLDLDDHLFTIKLTPNRSDCLSILGIAREISALTGTPMQELAIGEFTQHAIPNRKISLTASESCPRYIGRVISGVNAQALTPAWMVQRLERCGLRSISALVDVTNYVLLERGQPLHAFDLNKLNGNIEIRFARFGETLKLLNEQVVELQEDMLVIADEKGAVALAGVMGGADSAVDGATTDVFLESAFFLPSTITGKARILGFSSDSSYRFERGVDFLGTAAALDRATQLILEICGGQASPYSEQLGVLPLRQAVKLRSSRVHRVLGIPISTDKIAQTLKLLGMEFIRDADDFLVTPPSYRFDIQIEEDLIEEVARVHGYEKIMPSPTLARTTVLPLAEGQRPLTKLRQNMVVRDYQEAINYAFVEAEWERDLCRNISPVLLKNPISNQMSVMRSSLLGGLLSTLSTNLARKQPRVRLFEIGGCFTKEVGGYEQSERLAGLAYGGAVAEQWGMADRSVDFYDVKGDIDALFAPCILKYQAFSHPASHPGRSALIILDEKEIGWIGELHPQWQQKYEIPQSVIWFEVDIIATTLYAVPKATEISRFPPVRRDIAIQVEEAVTVGSLLQAMHAINAPKVVEISLFDQYRGKGVDPGKKSLAFRVLLQDTKKTLTDSEIEPSIAILVTALQENGAQLRS